MLIVIFLRWIYGYFDFCIKGRFPERFLNLASRNGLNLWNMQGSKEELHASAKITDLKNVELFARKTESELIIEKEKGLPYLCRSYKSRIGLLVGLICGVALSCYLSCFIWNISINSPAGINEYEIRNELRELGFYEGVLYDTNEIEHIERQLTLNDGRISWISINIFGTNAVVELSAKIDTEKNNTDESNVSNLKSTADGTITRINVQNGSAVVKVGEGVRKGQLLVSGIIEYTDGTNVLADSEGKVYAKTSRTITLSIPKQYDKPVLSDEYLYKRELNFFGITIPLTLCGNPDGSWYKNENILRMTLLENDLPISITEELWQKYENKTQKLNKEKAEEILTNRLKIYELFMLYSDDRSVISRKTVTEENENSFILKTSYEIEENICEKSYIQIKE